MEHQTHLLIDELSHHMFFCYIMGLGFVPFVSIRHSKGFIDILKHLTYLSCHRDTSTSPLYRSTPPQGSGSAGDGYTPAGGSYYGSLSKIELCPGRGGDMAEML